MAEIDIIRELDIIFWTIANISTLFNFTFCLNRVPNKRIEKSLRNANFVWMLYFTFMLIGNTLNIIWRLYILELYGAYLAGIIEYISLLFLNFGWLSMIGYLDTRLKLLKRPYFLYILLAVLPLSLIIRFHSATILEMIYYILVAIGFSLQPILFFLTGFRAEGIVRINSIRLGFASILFGIGLLIQEQNIAPFFPQIINLFYNTLHIPYFMISPILITISMVLYWIGIYNLYGGSEE